MRRGKKAGLVFLGCNYSLKINGTCMQNPKTAPSRRNALILIVVIVSAICWGLTYLLFIKDLQPEAQFQDWQSLGKPPESITKIVGVTFDGVIVQTISSKNYFYQILPVESKTAWKTYWRETQKELWLPSDDCGKKEQVEDAVQIEQTFGGTQQFVLSTC
jgi:hypothetical protein